MEIPLEKRSLRKRLSSERDRMPRADAEMRSRLIARRVLESRAWSEAKSVALYAPIRNEVDTRDLAAFDSKRIYYPKVPKSEHGSLEFYSVASLAELELGFMAKIPEPGLKSKRSKAALGEIDIVVVPGVGFDGEGYRLGFGKGYYDRTLKTYEGLVIGLAYDFQIVDRLPRESHDARCDWVVSESRIYRRD